MYPLFISFHYVRSLQLSLQICIDCAFIASFIEIATLERVCAFFCWINDAKTHLLQ